MTVASADVRNVPFDHARVDRLMEEAGIDVLIATSKHNVQYLLGGYKFIFFVAMDAIGHSRYLPFVIYEKGRPDHAAYVGNRMEGGEHQNRPFWTPTLTLPAGARSTQPILAAGICRRSERPTPGSASSRPSCRRMLMRFCASRCRTQNWSMGPRCWSGCAP